jgi:hypothetical protein
VIESGKALPYHFVLQQTTNSDLHERRHECSDAALP